MAPKKSRNLRKDTRFTDVVDQLAGGYQTIGQMVYAVLREAILSGAFAPGEWLRQESLAAAIGVSRIPVRTALLQLESEKLVDFHPHRGARVRTLSAAQINEIYRLRSLLESYALRQATTKISANRLDALRDLAAKLDEQPEGSDFLDVRVRFYRELYDADNNPLLVEMIEQLRSHVGRYLLGFRFNHQHGSSHTVLVEHVAAGNVTGAEAWLYAHLEGVRAGIQELASAEDTEFADDDDPAEDDDDSYIDTDSVRAGQILPGRPKRGSTTGAVSLAALSGTGNLKTIGPANTPDDAGRKPQGPAKGNGKPRSVASASAAQAAKGSARSSRSRSARSSG